MIFEQKIPDPGPKVLVSGSPFFLGTKILEAPNLWVRYRRLFFSYFFSQKNGHPISGSPQLGVELIKNELLVGPLEFTK